MGLISAGVMVGLWVFYLVTKHLSTLKYHLMSNVLLKQSAVTLVFFNVLNIAFSAGIHAKYSFYSECSPVFKTMSNLLLALALISILILLVLLSVLS